LKFTMSDTEDLGNSPAWYNLIYVNQKDSLIFRLSFFLYKFLEVL